jgi:hypothetical protein
MKSGAKIKPVKIKMKMLRADFFAAKSIVSVKLLQMYSMYPFYKNVISLTQSHRSKSVLDFLIFIFNGNPN